MGTQISPGESRARERTLMESSVHTDAASQSVATDAQLLRRAHAELELLYAVEQHIAAAESLQELIACVLSRLAAYMRFEAAALLLVSRGDGEVSSVVRGQPLVQRSVSRATALSWLERTRVRSGRITVLDALDDENGVLVPLPSPRSLKAYNAALSGGGDQFGVLQLIGPRDMHGDDVGLRRISLVAAQLGRAILRWREREQLLRSERLSQLGQSLGAVAHELQTPLHAVAGYVEIMASADAYDVRREYADRILRGLEHIQGAVQEVLAFARGQREVSASSVALGSFVEETKELLEPELARFGAVLEVQLEYSGNARFDAGKIRRALWNLARNAAESGAKKIVWKFARTGEYLVLECCDTRAGVPADISARLVDALAGQGAWSDVGMGLVITKKIIDAHCGHIQVKSDTGHGTVFRIELPF